MKMPNYIVLVWMQSHPHSSHPTGSQSGLLEKHPGCYDNGNTRKPVGRPVPTLINHSDQEGWEQQPAPRPGPCNLPRVLTVEDPTEKGREWVTPKPLLGDLQQSEGGCPSSQGLFHLNHTQNRCFFHVDHLCQRLEVDSLPNYILWVFLSLSEKKLFFPGK